MKELLGVVGLASFLLGMLLAVVILSPLLPQEEVTYYNSEEQCVEMTKTPCRHGRYTMWLAKGGK